LVYIAKSLNFRSALRSIINRRETLVYLVDRFSQKKTVWLFWFFQRLDATFFKNCRGSERRVEKEEGSGKAVLLGWMAGYQLKVPQEDQTESEKSSFFFPRF
jgi:hypothetical protein